MLVLRGVIVNRTHHKHKTYLFQMLYWAYWVLITLLAWKTSSPPPLWKKSSAEERSRAPQCELNNLYGIPVFGTWKIPIIYYCPLAHTSWRPTFSLPTFTPAASSSWRTCSTAPARSSFLSPRVQRCTSYRSRRRTGCAMLYSRNVEKKKLTTKRGSLSNTRTQRCTRAFRDINDRESGHRGDGKI